MQQMLFHEVKNQQHLKSHWMLLCFIRVYIQLSGAALSLSLLNTKFIHQKFNWILILRQFTIDAQSKWENASMLQENWLLQTLNFKARINYYMIYIIKLSNGAMENCQKLWIIIHQSHFLSRLFLNRAYDIILTNLQRNDWIYLLYSIRYILLQLVVHCLEENSLSSVYCHAHTGTHAHFLLYERYLYQRSGSCILYQMDNQTKQFRICGMKKKKMQQNWGR